MPKQHKQSLTANDAVVIAAVVAEEQKKTESAKLPSIDCCGRCIAFKLHSKTTMIGHCHLGPPATSHFNELSSVTAWPQVHAETGWCAQFKAKE